jgi:hypothetical protein
MTDDTKNPTTGKQKFTARVRRGFRVLLPHCEQAVDQLRDLNKQGKADVAAALAYLRENKE